MSLLVVYILEKKLSSKKKRIEKKKSSPPMAILRVCHHDCHLCCSYLLPQQRGGRKSGVWEMDHSVMKNT